MSHWEVQDYLHASDKWENMIHDNGKPVHFSSKEEAEKARLEYCKSRNWAWEAGYISDPFVPDDYRIVEVNECLMQRIVSFFIRILMSVESRRLKI